MKIIESTREIVINSLLTVKRLFKESEHDFYMLEVSDDGQGGPFVVEEDGSKVIVALKRDTAKKLAEVILQDLKANP